MGQLKRNTIMMQIMNFHKFQSMNLLVFTSQIKKLLLRKCSVKISFLLRNLKKRNCAVTIFLGVTDK